MTECFSDNIGELEPSATLAIAARAKAMKRQGVDLVDLSAGQPDFPTPPFICRAAREAIERGETRYTPAGGIPELRAAIARKLGAEDGYDCTPEQVVVTAGAKQAIFNAIFCLFGPGDEVLIPVPYWVSYPAITALARARGRLVETSRESGFRLTTDDLERVVTERTRGLILNSPNNPTGSVYTPEELAGIVSFCRERSIWILSDEIYEKIVYGDVRFRSIASIPGVDPERIVVVNGFSKTWSMTGWRVGYAAAPPALAGAIESLQSQTTSNTSSISQWAALAALEDEEPAREILDRMLEKFARRRERMLERVTGELGLPCVDPQGAFYVFADASACYGLRVGRFEITGSISLCRYLLEEGGVALIPGIAFGRDDFIRLSYATSLKEIERAMDRLAESMATIRKTGTPLSGAP